MKIRVEGTRTECDDAVAVLRNGFEVQEVSRFYENRGETIRGRVYVEVALKPSSVVRADAARLDRKELGR